MDNKHQLEPYSFARTPVEPPQPSYTFDFPTKLDNPILTFEHPKQPDVSESRLDEIERAAEKCDLLFLSDEETKAFEKRLKQKYPNSGPFLYSFALDHDKCQPTGRISGEPMEIKLNMTFSTPLSETYELSTLEERQKALLKDRIKRSDQVSGKVTDIPENATFEQLHATWQRIYAKHEQHLRESKHSLDVKKDQTYWRAKFNLCLDEIHRHAAMSTVDWGSFKYSNFLSGNTNAALVFLEAVNGKDWLAKFLQRTIRKLEGHWPVRNEVKKPEMGPEEWKWRHKFYACMSEMVKARRECDRLCRSEWASTIFVCRVKEKFPSALLGMISLRRRAGMYCVTFPK